MSVCLHFWHSKSFRVYYIVTEVGCTCACMCLLLFWQSGHSANKFSPSRHFAASLLLLIFNKIYHPDCVLALAKQLEVRKFKPQLVFRVSHEFCANRWQNPEEIITVLKMIYCKKNWKRLQCTVEAKHSKINGFTDFIFIMRNFSWVHNSDPYVAEGCSAPSHTLLQFTLWSLWLNLASPFLKFRKAVYNMPQFLATGTHE